jgi:hypothetical protein
VESLATGLHARIGRQAVARYLVTTSIYQNGSIAYPKGAMVELTSAQMTALGASNFQTANNPVNTNGTQAGSPTHDLAGEAAGVSN